MKRQTVDPMWIFGLSLIASLVLWYPTLKLVMAGTIDISDAGIRYFLALAVAWAGVYGVSTIVAMYASEPRRPAPPPPRPAAAHPIRRVEDAPAAETAETNAA
jgi:hypothetical protein